MQTRDSDTWSAWPRDFPQARNVEERAWYELDVYQPHTRVNMRNYLRSVYLYTY